MSASRKLPIGIQDFEDLRTNDYLYVDKTSYVYQLKTSGKPYFLSRPRRFGKSLFLSTLKAYFLGKKEIFDGLAIADLEKEWLEYPVIYIDLNKASYQDVHILNDVLDEILKDHEAEWGVTNIAAQLSLRFDNLIKTANQKSQCKVVVLVDEYDKPLVSTLDKAGGVEGGISNGEPIIITYTMKPIPSLVNSLVSVNLKTKRMSKAEIVRSDVCAVAALGVIGESAVACEIANAFKEKFGADSLQDIKNNFDLYNKRIKAL